MNSVMAKARIRLHYFVVLTVAFAASWAQVSACLMPCIGPPIDIPADEYIFIGEVVGSAEPLEIVTEGRGGTTTTAWWGLQVRVIEFVSAPVDAPRRYEVYPHSHGIDCDVLPIPPVQLDQRYPLGSRVRVVGKLLSNSPFRSRLTTDPDPSVARLEAATYCGDFIPDRKLPVEWLTEGNLDYERVSKALNFDEGSDLAFAVLQDLSRLRSAHKEKKKVTIIKRLIYCPYWTTATCAQLVASHLTDGAQRDGLIQQCAIIHDRN